MAGTGVYAGDELGDGSDFRVGAASAVVGERDFRVDEGNGGKHYGRGGAQMFRRALVVGELAMALVLLIGCGLMLRAFWKLQEVHTGMAPTT